MCKKHVNTKDIHNLEMGRVIQDAKSWVQCALLGTPEARSQQAVIWERCPLIRSIHHSYEGDLSRIAHFLLNREGGYSESAFGRDPDREDGLERVEWDEIRNKGLEDTRVTAGVFHMSSERPAVACCSF